MDSKSRSSSLNTRPAYHRNLSTVLREEYKANIPNIYRSTSIVCTLGPSSHEVHEIADLIKAGMNIARMNFSHGSHEYHAETIKNIREAMKLTGKKIAFLLDTKGPEIRTGLLQTGTVMLEAGQNLTIHTDAPDEFKGTKEAINLDYKNLVNVVKVGNLIKIDDGLIVCKVVSIDVDACTLEVIVQNSSELGQRKGVNLPGVVVDLPALTEKDKRDLNFGMEQGVDFIAQSFTRKAQDVLDLKAVLGEKGKNIQIICKIENQEGLDNFSGILDVCDGIMVARGDLGVEIPIQKVCSAQKNMIFQCNLAGKPVITATQMLESMVKNPRPTRAEASDVSNAVFDGTDCVMLSGETAKGDYPREAVETMSRICAKAEEAVNYQAVFDQVLANTHKPLKAAQTIASSAVMASNDMNAHAIVCVTKTGFSARCVSKFHPRPTIPILAVTKDSQVERQLLLSRGVYPCLVNEDASNDDIIQRGIDYGIERGFLQSGSVVIVVKGREPGTTDSMQLFTIP